MRCVAGAEWSVADEVLQNKRAIRVGMCAMVLLAGCAEMSDRSEPIPYRLDTGGVQLVGSELRIDFGRTDHSTVPAMSKLIGTGPVEEISCGSVTGVVWPDDVTLFFAGGDFRGWQTSVTSEGQTC